MPGELVHNLDLLSDKHVQVSHPTVIFVSGPPCCGKNTLAKHIGSHFGLPVMTEDWIKESLFDSLGWGDRKWSRLLTKASELLLFRYLESQVIAGRSCVIEGEFAFLLKSGYFEEISERSDFFPLQVVCHAPVDVLVGRLEAQAQNCVRHPGHLDAILLDERRADLENYHYDQYLIGREVIDIEITDIQILDESHLFEKIGKILTQDNR